MAVGDDFQSIYGFRDADPDNMLKFYERLDETGETFFLTDNYRSVQNVVNFGNRVIARNVNKVDKVITTTREEGDPVINLWRKTHRLACGMKAYFFHLLFT